MLNKTLLKIILFIVSVLVPLYFIARIMDCKGRKIYIEKPSYVITIKDQKYNYIVAGSSRVHNNFNTLLFDSLTGLNGFNIGYDGSGLAQIYLTLRFFLENGNKTNHCLLQVEDKLLIDANKAFTYPFHEYFFLPYINEPHVDECFKQNVEPVKYFMWKYLPYTKYAEFNNYYSLFSFLRPPLPATKMLKEKGYERLELQHSKNFPATGYSSEKEDAAVDVRNLFYLDEIRKLCVKYGTRLILYASPVYDKFMATGKNEKLHQAILDFVKKNNVPYYNLMSHANFKGHLLFYDETHLNSLGTDKFMQQLSDTLRKELCLKNWAQLNACK